ncbi:extracellular solute-binding protein family 3/GGDEF domain protein [Vibrio ponticus]|nr:extracellular solute-binding protein family 3/GGDEF domain protein [Vibrio ponticus]
MRCLLLLSLLLSSFHLFASNLPSKDPLIIANSKAWKPFSFINSKGEPDGILIDYWREFSRVTGQPIEFLLLDWNDSLVAVKEGRADIHAGLLFSVERDDFLEFSQPIITIDTQLFVSRELLEVDTTTLFSGEHSYRFGVVDGGFEQSHSEQRYPNLNFVAFANNAQMLEAAFDGDIDAFVADLQVANFYFHSLEKGQQFSGIQHLYTGILRPAVAEGNNDLLGFLAQGMTKISSETKHKIFSRWMYIETVYPSYLIPVVIALSVIAVLSYIVILRMAVRSKTLELKTANRELKILSQVDQLTGLSNRRHFYSQFSHRVSTGGHTCVMLFDIDDFKSINDTFGHQVGDEVIKSVGQAVNSVVDKRHLVGRIGGEEFAVVCKKISLAEAEELAEQIREAVRQQVIFEDQRRVTISLGCAYYHKSSLSISLSEADNLMYQAKAKGKDCVICREYDEVPTLMLTPL